MERQKPTIEIEGTIFIVDVARQMLTQKDDPGNEMSFTDMRDNSNNYSFWYNLKNKNLEEHKWDGDAKVIVIPQMRDLDPEGMMLAYNCTEPDTWFKYDFEIVVDQEVLAERKQGKQPVIDIAGHVFYVNLHAGFLQPKGDFSTMGIPIDHMDSYYDDEAHAYIFPYDPQKHELVLLDFSELTEIPDGLLLVEVPRQQQLDPYRYAKKHCPERTEQMLRKYPLQMNRKARIIPWEETGVMEILKQNKDRVRQKDRQSTIQGEKITKKRGRRM